ncbi:MAG: DUF418 domain-containing protein [Myxococcota bacterium]
MTQRIQALDGLRGFALLGIAVANVQWFSGYAVDPSPAKDLLGLDAAVTFGLHLFVDGKFYGLFSLLFGASFQLLLDQAKRRGIPPAVAARRRLFALGLLGSLHAVFLWFGDILTLYAVAAIPLRALLRLRDRTILAISLVLLAIPAVLSALLFVALDPAATDFAYGPAEHLPAFASGDLLALWHANLAFLKQRYFLALLSGRLPRLLGLFLLGALLLRHRPAPNRPQLAALTLLALATNLAHASLAHVQPLPPSGLGVARDAIGCIAIPAGALAYVGLLWGVLGRNGRVQTALASAGRLSATHYLSQSLVFAGVFYGVGFGGWGAMGATASGLFALVVVLGQAAASSRWTRDSRGPAEALLRVLNAGS